MIPPVTRACCKRTPKGVPEPRILYETNLPLPQQEEPAIGPLASLQDAHICGEDTGGGASLNPRLPLFEPFGFRKGEKVATWYYTNSTNYPDYPLR
jgi:hypothetical protein